MKIILRKKSQTSYLLALLGLLPCFFSFFIDFLGLPYMIHYLMDLLWLLLLIYIFLGRQQIKQTGARNIAVLVIFYLVYTSAISVIQFQSAFYYLWGVRNVFRLYVTFFSVAVFLKKKDADGLFCIFDVLFWINVAVSLVQFFVLDFAGDYLGGIFGTEKGANGYTTVFHTIIITRDVLLYLEKKEKIGVLAIKVIAALLIAALAEIKFFFVLFALILALASLFTNFTWRKLWVLWGGVALVVIGAAVLALVFPSSDGFLSLEYFLTAATSSKGYTSAGDLNRLNAIPVINELWLQNGWQQTFGLGLGNCDYAGFDFLITPFYKDYGHMHYSWFTYAFVYLETGWVGLVCYYGFFALVFLGAWKIERYSEGTPKTYCRMSRVLAFCCMIISLYNSSMRTEAGYMMYFALAVPFALNRETKTRMLKNEISK